MARESIPWGKILMTIAGEIPWGMLIRAALSFIIKQAPAVAEGKNGKTAMIENVDMMEEATKRDFALSGGATDEDGNLKGVDWTILSIVHQVAYAIWAKTHAPNKFNEMEDSIRIWAEKMDDKYNYFSDESRVKYEETNLMSFYVNPPDRPVG